MTRHSPHRLIVTAALVPLAATGLTVALDRPGDAATAGDRTSPAEARLVDRVPTPVLHWTACQQIAECATVRLPLDYDSPHGATIGVGLLRIKAKDPAHRIGTLFANPGGPGDSATDFVLQNAPGLPESIQDRFDIVGIDPRGVGLSQQLRCFATTEQQSLVEGRLNFADTPDTPAEQRPWIGAAQALGRACSTTARPIASAMSDTEDARDMDVLRRAVGDSKLTFLAESAGSYLGQVYANMFPDRVRAIALDGIVDPEAFAGTPATAGVPVFDRIGAAAASSRALNELLKRCQQAGQSRCSFAGADTRARFDRLAAQFRAHPLRLAAPGVTAITYTYANLISDTEHWLHDPDGYLGLFADLTDLARLTAPGGGSDHDALVRDFLGRHPATPPVPGYDNFLEAFSAISCTDGLHAADAASWPAAATAADRAARYFGAYYAWLSAQCARKTWTARDEDAYRGPFNRRTAAPVLVVGNRWDPATSYDNAVKVAGLLPNSRLVSSDSWGHQALATSDCVDNAVFDYLIDPLAPAPKTTFCRGDVQPFTPVPGTH
jgi:pimeloyl-ACP methyl ester carboxylesterase